MINYSIKELMGLCSDYALDAQIQKILFSLDLWVPKAAREVHIDNVAQQHYSAASFSGFNRARSPSKLDSSNNNNRLRRTLAARSMSAEVFRGTIDTFNSGPHVRDSTKVNSTTSSSQKKSSTGQTLEQIPSTGSTQAKLMPILEGGETEESTSRIHFSTTTLDWTPAENESTNRTPMDALFELSVRADTALKTALCENNSTVPPVTTNDRLTIRKSVSVMNQKQKVGSGRSLIRAKSDMLSSDTNRKRTLTHLARLSEKYFNDEPKIIAEIEELEVEYLFNYIRHLKTFPKYAQMSEDEILQEVESDPHTLRQRTKEILKGKMSESYAEYIAKYPIKKQRQREQPTTPNKYRKCSRRCFDGQLRTWRRNLHQFDDIPAGTINDNENDDLAPTE